MRPQTRSDQHLDEPEFKGYYGHKEKVIIASKGAHSMIQATISEIKNRLSYYLRLVRGGAQIEILDRKTPVARLVHVASMTSDEGRSTWIKEIEQLGLVEPPAERGYPAGFFHVENMPSPPEETRTGVLQALLEERESGR
jgi:antitoxin (DNA-binding transcriptional repressor) of toxin-antitoxin stability system